MRQVVLDTETTGLEVREGHRIIELGCVELEGRRFTGRNFHRYLQPDREIDDGALSVHGISQEFLRDKPRFADVADELTEYLSGAELVIHNAAFDVGFLDNELALARAGSRVADLCTVLDTLELARKLHPGQRNSLDALCKRYQVDNSHREMHGALLDAQILAGVYLAMTGGQTSLDLAVETASPARGAGSAAAAPLADADLRVIRASDDERAAHEARLGAIEEASGGPCVWRRLGG